MVGVGGSSPLGRTIQCFTLSLLPDFYFLSSLFSIFAQISSDTALSLFLYLFQLILPLYIA